MKKKHKYIVILCFVGSLVLWLFYVMFLVYQPAYVHRFLTPTHIEAAEDFYYANKDSLHQLSQLQETVEGDTRYTYTFHEHNFNTPDIPEEFLDTLQELESNTNKIYSVTIDKYGVTVFVGSGTSYDVYLYHGENDFDYGETKEALLEDGWRILAPF